jgi:hypothetical protein
MEFTFYNNSSQLTFSGDGITYGYIGRATAQSLTQAGTSTVSNTTGRSTYTIDWPADIIVVLPVKTSGSTALINTTQSGSTWTITVHKGTTSTDSNGFSIQEYTEVYVYGAPPSTTDSSFMMYDVNGVPCADLTKTPIFVRGLLSLSSTVTDTTWTPPSSITSPGIIGAPPGYRSSTVQSGSSWINKQFGYGWILESDGSISRVIYLETWNKDDGPISVQNVVNQTTNIVTSVSGL